LRGSADAVALAAVLLACSVTSPETEVKAAVTALAPLDGLDAGAARVDIGRLRLADVTVAVDGARARVVAVAEAGGRVRFAGQEPTVAYVGREAFSVERCASRRWCAAEGALPALRGVVAALAEAPRGDGAWVLAWHIRVERDRATAGEDWVPGEGGPTRRARWELLRDGERWRVVAGP
jgi:hypothetical protein